MLWHVPWYGWVIMVVVVTIVTFFRFGGWLLAKGFFLGWGDGPSKQAMDDEQVALCEDGC